METRLKVSGMTCAHCEKAVQTALNEVTGVQSAAVDREAGTALVRGSAGTADLIAAVAEAGYSAQPLTA